jgi:small conductance mechanosensitive channel
MGNFQLPDVDLVFLLTRAARVVFIFAGAIVSAFLMRRLVNRLRYQIVKMGEGAEASSEMELEKRAATFAGILRTLITVLVSTIAAGMALREMGFDVGPLIAGAGVAGIAVGLGAQNLFRDVISGFFVLIEDQVRVGDIAIVNGVGGVVEELNLRTIVLRDAEGVVHIFPNGGVTSLANRTREFSYYMFNIGLSYRSDVDRAIAAMREVDAAIRREEAYGRLIREPIDVFGVDQFLETGVLVKARIKTVPGKQWEVGREMNRRIKILFDEKGIEFQTKAAKIEAPPGAVLPGVIASPAAPAAALAREDLRAIVREVMEEMSRAERPGA